MSVPHRAVENEELVVLVGDVEEYLFIGINLLRTATTRRVHAMRLTGISKYVEVVFAPNSQEGSGKEGV